MRYLAWFGVVFTTLLTIIYVAVFTPPGNAMIKPYIESKIEEQTAMQSKFSTFMFNTSDFEMVLELNQTNYIKAKGTYSLFTRSFDFAYEIGFQKLEALSKLTGMPLRGTFFTNGVAKGDLKFMKIDGMTDIGNGKSAYHATLSDLSLSSFNMKMRDAKLESVLDLFSKNPYATADIDLEINLKNIMPHAMDGDLIVKSKNAKLDPKFMKSDFNVTIPKTSFTMDLAAKLKGDDIEYRYNLLSNLFKITSFGKVAPNPLKADIAYSLNVEDLEVLKPLSGADIRGALKLEGEIKGTKESLRVEGKSDIASSNTHFQATLSDFKPMDIKAKIENLEIEKLLYMLKQPSYGGGKLSVDADISDLKSGNLAGKISTVVKEGVLNSAYLSRAYGFKSLMPHTAYSLEATTLLDKDMLQSKVDLNSNIANLDMQSVKFNLKEGSLKSDYSIEVADLGKLFFITNQRMRGSLLANGEISKAKDLEATLRSNAADGKIEAKLYNDDLHIDIASVKTDKILYTFIYPEFIDASLNAKVNYNLSQSKGSISAEISRAKFQKNQLFDSVKEFAMLDMYKEFFNGKASARIENENILASLDLLSINSAIKVQEAKINTKTNEIDTDLTLKIKKEEYNAILKGDIASPRLTLDLEKFMKTEAGKNVQKKINKSVDDLLKKLIK